MSTQQPTPEDKNQMKLPLDSEYRKLQSSPPSPMLDLDDVLPEQTIEEQLESLLPDIKDRKYRKHYERKGHHMRVSELLIAMASWLESTENEALLLAEDNQACLEATAKTCLAAAEILKAGAAELEVLEPAEPSQLTPEAFEHLQEVLAAFDVSGDEDLKKTANVIDELLVTISSPPNWATNYKEAQQNRLDVLEKLYKEPKKELDIKNKVTEAVKAIDKAPVFKEYRTQQYGLSSRVCPEHYSPLARVGEDMWQCQMDKKIYNWKTGFTLENGAKVPGGDVANQTPMTFPTPHMIFDSRESRLNGYTPSKK